MKKFMLCCIILLSIGLVACSQNNEDRGIIGTWERDLSAYIHLDLGFSEYFIFNEDGTGEFRRVSGPMMDVYTIAEFYWEQQEEGILLKEPIRTIEFRGMENRDNPPTIFFDSSNPNTDVVPSEWTFVLYRGTLLVPDLIYGQQVPYRRID